jgi:hypothetical protein
MTLNRLLWILWVAGTLAIAGVAVTRIYIAGDRTSLLPGQTDGVHHQLEIACETCHTAKPFASQAKIKKNLNKTCVTCHKEELKAANDSHPIKKFKNPRMAAYWDKVDARFCTTCHSEHEPEITLTGLLTLPGDYCVACHSQGDQDVRVNRPSHAELTFDTCASSGCHNYHDNRALYEDYLVKHAAQPDIHPVPVSPARAMSRERERPNMSEIQTYLASVNAPEQANDPVVAEHWAGSAHASADVTCKSCHAPKAETASAVLSDWIEKPGEEACASCHKAQAKTFARGRHGMSRHPDIAKPRKTKTMLKQLGVKKPSPEMVETIEAYLEDPAPAPQMSTAKARVALAPELMDQTVTCNSCHKPHAQDLTYAQVDGCLSCHADDHSLAYQSSPHFELWQQELSGDLPAGSGVTCASCHMPSEIKKKHVLTNHNQNDTLRPNEKMIRAVCMDCHGLGFAIDALADPALIANNFSGHPIAHIESIDWAINRVEQPASVSTD